MTRLLPLILLVGALRFPPSAVSLEPPPLPARAPAFIELRDQYDAPQTLSFPTTNAILLTIADKQGSEQVGGWMAALKRRYAGRVDIRGLADCKGAPGFLQGRIRKKFQETHTYPVMMDWTGKVCVQLGFQPGVANLLVLRRDGTIEARFAGEASAAAVAEARHVLDNLLKSPPPAGLIGRPPAL